MIFTFTNISKDLKTDDAEEVLKTLPDVNASPTLNQNSEVCINQYYNDNIMSDNLVKGVAIKLPLYTGNYITLAPNETIIIRTNNVKQSTFYKEVVKSFVNNIYYKLLQCEISEQNYETWKNVSQLTWAELSSLTWGELGNMI